MNLKCHRPNRSQQEDVHDLTLHLVSPWLLRAPFLTVRLVLGHFLFTISQPVLTNVTPPPTVGEESISLQEIPSVYDTSNYTQRVIKIPSFITILTSNEITKYGYRTLADVLQSINGFYVTSDRNYRYLGFRGFGGPADYNARVLLLVEEHRLNDNLYDAAAIGMVSPFDGDLIDRQDFLPQDGRTFWLKPKYSF